jgi:hypothetical protein
MQPVVMARPKTMVQSSLETRREAPHVEGVPLVRTLVWVASFDLICCIEGAADSLRTES